MIITSIFTIFLNVLSFLCKVSFQTRSFFSNDPKLYSLDKRNIWKYFEKRSKFRSQIFICFTQYCHAFQCLASVRARIQDFTTCAKTLQCLASVRARIQDFTTWAKTFQYLASVRARIQGFTTLAKTFQCLASVRARIQDFTTWANTFENIERKMLITSNFCIP